MEQELEQELEKEISEEEKKEIDNSPRRIERHYFMQWLALPDKYRNKKFGMPATQKEFSEKYGVSEQTLSFWKNNDEFLKEVSIYRRKKYLGKASNVMDALYEKAVKTGDGKEVKLFMEMIGEYTEKRDVNVNGLAELLKETGIQDEPLVK